MPTQANNFIGGIMELADESLWMPSERILANCYHPKLHSKHEAYSKLPMHAQLYIDRLDKQSAKWEHMPYFKAGVSNTRIAILNGYHKADRLLNCMMIPNKYDFKLSYSRCSLADLCPFCAYLKGQNLLKKYGLAWEPGSWHRLVFSIKGFVSLSHNCGDDMLSVWEAIRACVKRWASNFEGCVGWEELTVNSFWPEVLCTPHVNVLIRNAGDLDLELFAQIVAEEWQARGLSVLPDPQLAPPNNEAHFYELLKYVKPIDLLTPYNSGYLAAKAAGRLECFHQEVRGFFEGYAVHTTEYRHYLVKPSRRKVLRPYTRIACFYLGNCHGSAKQALGIKPAVRQTKAHQDRIRIMAQNAKEDELFQCQCQEENATKPNPALIGMHSLGANA